MSKEIIPQEVLMAKILLLRGQKVILDRDLAALYGVETKVLNRAVKRNIDRFPEDFMLRVSRQEYAEILRCQFGTLRHGKHSKYLANAFTENGVAMLSGVLNSKRAIEVNIQIIRTFVRLRQLLNTHRDLARKLAELEKKYDAQFKGVFDAINALMDPATDAPKLIEGFKPGRK